MKTNQLSSVPEIVPNAPADLMIFHLVNGVNSRLYIVTHSGIFFNCFLFQDEIGA
ncbi:hypothetical protein GW750_07590 [bacterium]|nr:hypothetical protein [bacterium]